MDPLHRWLAGKLARTLGPARVGLELWNGASLYESPDPPIGTLLVRDAHTLRGLVFDPHLQFGETYMTGTLDVRGDFVAVLEALSRQSFDLSLRERIELKFLGTNTLDRSRTNVHHHYDLGNDFYRTWLDEQLVYTCAYFEHPDVSLEEAQRAKLDLVCRKLRLQAGETVIEAGCGWGALALHMAREFGVRVKAFNVSREQIAWARARAEREGLAGQVEFIDDDYRNVTGRYDAFVSVGMLEHVGARHFPSLAEVIRRVVPRSGGRGLLHFIGRDIPRPLNAWIHRRIFPGAYPPALAEVITQILGHARMSVVDVENLRLHYARTLYHWRRRFLAAENWVRSRYGDQFYRAWNLYLAGSEATFLAGTMQLFQVVFSPAESKPPYITRASLYTEEEADQWFAVTR